MNKHFGIAHVRCILRLLAPSPANFPENACNRESKRKGEKEKEERGKAEKDIERRRGREGGRDRWSERAWVKTRAGKRESMG